MYHLYIKRSLLSSDLSGFSLDCRDFLKTSLSKTDGNTHLGYEDVNDNTYRVKEGLADKHKNLPTAFF